MLVKSIVCRSSLFLYAGGSNGDSEEQLIDELDIFIVLTTLPGPLSCCVEESVTSDLTPVASNLGLTPNLCTQR